MNVTSDAEVTNTQRTVALFLLTAIYIFNFADRQIVAILAEPIKRDLGLSDTQLGLVSGVVFSLFYSTFGIPVGWLADRTNRVRLIAAACAAWSVCSAAGGLATNFLQLALARIGVGIGEAGGSPPSLSLIGDLFPPAARARAIAVFSLAIAVGPAFASGLGGGLAAHYGWRVALTAVAAPGVILAVMLLIMVREPVRPPVPAGRRSGERPLAVIGSFLRDPALARTAVTTGMSAFVAYGVSSWTPAMLIRTKGMDLTDIALHFTIAAGVMTSLGILTSGWIIDRWAVRNPRVYALLPGTAFLIAPFFLAGALVADTWQLSLLLLCVPMLLNSVWLSPALALVQAVVPPERRAASSAILLFALNLIGLGGGPLYVGMISDAARDAWGTQSLLVGLGAIVPVYLLTAAAHFRTAPVVAATLHRG